MSIDEQKPVDFLVNEGKSLYQAKQYLSAAEAFQKAAEAYEALAEALLAAEMRNNQCVSLLQAKKPQQALEVVQGTSKIFLDAGEITKAGMALANQATALSDLGEIGSALESYLAAGELFKSVEEGELYLETMQTVSSLKLRSRDVIGAVFSMQRGLEGVEKPTWKQKILKNLLKVLDKILNK
jgi:tetratricopeptide (TPR) repeat protein